MAMVQFRDEQAQPQINVTRRMFPPKRVDQIEQWWKKCRLTIPQIPTLEQDGWHLFGDVEITPKWIKWEIRKVDDLSRRCYVIVDRTAPSIGT